MGFPFLAGFYSKDVLGTAVRNLIKLTSKLQVKLT